MHDSKPSELPDSGGPKTGLPESEPMDAAKVSRGHKKSNRPGSPYAPLIYTALLYSLFLFLFTVGMESGPIVLIPIFSGVAATVVLVSYWSAYGTGSYLKRCFFAHLVGSIPAIGLLLGVLIMAISNNNDATEVFHGGIVLVLGVIPASVGGQFPHWIIRGLSGLQFVWKDDPIGQAFNLRDIFAITFVCALCFAIPQVAFNSVEQNPTWFVNSNPNYITKTDEKGNIEYVRAETEKELTEARRQARKNMLFATYWGYGTAFVVSLIGSAISIPILWFVFRLKDGSTGCLFAFLYAGGTGLLVVIVIGLVARGNVPGQAVMSLLTLTTVLCAAIALPLVAMRESGFRFNSPRSKQVASDQGR